ncbi:amidase family protein [Streptomyces sp. NBC_00102]|uniref:amidase family protein n=1 Tax=Streptomyces sp. NBC_00102 TaxID=2975652 RepID=UPI00224CCE00|nr:amidase family protein [Streptomyces sp. NBC_00102]MCX5395546.1 amidase family protein [Streptomyces sp. NBC_00102]
MTSVRTSPAADPAPLPLIGPYVPWLPVAGLPEPAAGRGLSGARIAVKDVIDLAGTPTGNGHPLLLAEAVPATRHADCLGRLIDAGAVPAGKAHTDELAYSLGGTNAHYGAPANPAAPGHLCGGSSSGTAAAVAGRLADIGLGTDTAGSIRVPASYCGLYGLRPSHARADRTGISPLAPSFDTPGLLTRSLPLLRDAAAALLAGTEADDRAPVRVLAPADLWSLATGPVRAALAPALDRLVEGLDLPLDRSPLFDGLAPVPHTEARDAFKTVQAAEVWRAHGPWVTRARPAFGPHVAERLRIAAGVDGAREEAARARVSAVARWLGRRLDGAVLAIPATPTPAPAHASTSSADRDALLALTCLAGLGGLPALTVPGPRSEGLPVGLCLLTVPGGDERLIAAGMSMEPRRA